MDTLEKIKQQISKNPVILYMKGSPLMPNCGFSARVSHILNRHHTAYAYVDILENPDIRATLPGFANWPTFPQLYIQGELVGGCDIVAEMDENQELLPMLLQADAIIEEGEPSIIEA